MDEQPDELALLIAEWEKKPGFIEARLDAGVRFDLVEALRAERKRLGLTQKKIAKRMGVKQPTVAEFENSCGDYYLSTVQRYARALGAQLDVRLVLPVDIPG